MIKTTKRRSISIKSHTLKSILGVRKFEKDGEVRLQDKRGKTVKDREFETLSETERLKLEILRLKRTKRIFRN